MKLKYLSAFCLFFSFVVLFNLGVMSNISCFATDKEVRYKAMATMEVDSKRLLYSYNENEKLPMASTTKIITAICVIENCEDLDCVVEIPKEAQGVEGSSIYLRTGEHLSVRELLYGLMLQSGNDSAVALAIQISGSVEKFMELTNLFCNQIGATNTHLVTPNGLHDKEHYTTARDLALISSYALSNPIFKEIVKTQKIDIANEMKDEPRVIKNKNRLLKSLEGCTGVKTGYTREAGRCLVASQEKNGMEVVCVVLNCSPMFAECERLLTLAHNEFQVMQLLTEYNHLGHCLVKKNNEFEKINIMNKDGFTYPLSANEMTNVRVSASIPEYVVAPVVKDQIIGEINICLGNQLLFCTKIYSIDEVKEITFQDILNKVIQKM